MFIYHSHFILSLEVLGFGVIVLYYMVIVPSKGHVKYWVKMSAIWKGRAFWIHPCGCKIEKKNGTLDSGIHERTFSVMVPISILLAFAENFLDIAMSAPTKAEREVCWEARDKLWECLDQNSDDVTSCMKHRKKFEESCSKTWVSNSFVSWLISPV